MPTEEQKKGYYDAFKLFDNQGNDTIPKESLGDLLRALNQNPSQAEVAEVTKGVGDKITFEQFLKILERPGGFTPAGTYEEFVEGFQVLDKDRSGYISTGELRYVLTSMGEKLSDAEVDELLKGVEVDKNGNVNYEKFVKLIMSG